MASTIANRSARPTTHGGFALETNEARSLLRYISCPNGFQNVTKQRFMAECHQEMGNGFVLARIAPTA